MSIRGDVGWMGMLDEIIDDYAIPRLTFNPDFPESTIQNSRTKSFEKMMMKKK